MYLVAVGDYDQADQRLKKYLDGATAVDSQNLLALAQTYALDEGFEPGTLRALYQSASLIRQQMDWRVLRGVLALEKGDTQAAARIFREVVQMSLPHLDPSTTAALLDGRIPLTQAAQLGTEGPARGWPGLDFGTRGIAYHYLPLLQQHGADKDQVAHP